MLIIVRVVSNFSESVERTRLVLGVISLLNNYCELILFRPDTKKDEVVNKKMGFEKWDIS